MDKLEHYRTCLQTFLQSYSSYGPKNPEVETQIICDTTHDHYMLFRTGYGVGWGATDASLHLPL